jgi:uncharacterized protein (TIGR02145 family)
MKKNPKLPVYMLVLVATVSILVNSCKKEENEEPLTVTDIDGNVYNTVTIGTQVWFKENLKTTKYSNGDIIGTTNPATLDIRDESNPKYQWAYNGDESNVVTYGLLYTSFAAADSRNICPSGWHVPSTQEMETLITSAGGRDIAGGKLKETGTAHWEAPNTGVDDYYGFKALPGGNKVPLGDFWGLGKYGFWWANNGYAMSMSAAHTTASIFFESYRYRGYSVRCVKD